MGDILPFKSIKELVPVRTTLFPSLEYQGDRDLLEIRTPLRLSTSLWNSVASAVAAVPPGKTGFVIRIERQANGIDTLVGFKLSEHLSIAGGWHHGGDDIVGAQVVFAR